MSNKKRKPRGAAHQQQAPGSAAKAGATGDYASREDVVVPLVEETLQVGKQWVEAGAVEVRKTVQTRTETVPVDLTHEQVDIQRVPINRVLAPGEDVAPRQEGDVLIIPLVEEELVVTRRQVIREEVHVRKRLVVAQQEVSDTLRSEHLDVQTTGNIESLD